MLVHTVFFYLKDEVSESRAAAFAEDVNTLGAIETVKHIWVGTPAATADRPVIDKGYAVGLTTVFESLADHDVYQDHELHHAFIARNKDIWAKVQIYDAD